MLQRHHPVGAEPWRKRLPSHRHRRFRSAAAAGAERAALRALAAAGCVLPGAPGPQPAAVEEP